MRIDPSGYLVALDDEPVLPSASRSALDAFWRWRLRRLLARIGANRRRCEEGSRGYTAFERLYDVTAAELRKMEMGEPLWPRSLSLKLDAMAAAERPRGPR